MNTITELIDKILDWPIIVQGALGSFLFWLAYIVVKKIVSFISQKISSEKQLGYFFIQHARKCYKNEIYEDSADSYFTVLYAGMHYFLKFVLVVFVGFLLERIIPVFGYVGYFIGFYFLFRALSYLPHFDTLDKMEKKEKEKEIEE